MANLIISQNSPIDSLKGALKNAKHDTTRCNILMILCDQASSEELQGYYEDLRILAEKNSLMEGKLRSKYIKHLAFAINKIGISYAMQSDYPKALEYFFRCLKLNEEIGEKQRVGVILSNISRIYSLQGEFPKAMEYLFRGLKISEETGDKKQLGITLSNIAGIYNVQTEYNKALEYYFKGLKLCEETGNMIQAGTNLCEIGEVYAKQADYVKALEYFFKSLKVNTEIENKRGIGVVFGDIGNVYNFQSDYVKAIEYTSKALKMHEELGNRQGVAIANGNIGSFYTSLGKFKEAEFHLKKALLISKEIGTKDLEKSFYELLSHLYERSNRPALALENYKEYIALKDTIFSHENSKKLLRSEMNHEFEKKEMEAKVIQEKKDIIAAEELKQKEKERNYFIVGFGLVIILVLFIFRGYRQKQKDNAIITEQKHLVEEKQKEIIDSIHYAQRIQRALITPEKYIDRKLRDLQN